MAQRNVYQICQKTRNRLWSRQASSKRYKGQQKPENLGERLEILAEIVEILTEILETPAKILETLAEILETLAEILEILEILETLAEILEILEILETPANMLEMLEIIEIVEILKMTTQANIEGNKKQDAHVPCKGYGTANCHAFRGNPAVDKDD
jgi:hypothetical protein